MSTCSNGHQSATIDFCDVCGLPMAGGAAPVVAPPAQTCPHCGAPRPAAALFCEACGYDYTTGALPTTDLAEALGLARSEPDQIAEPGSETSAGAAWDSSHERSTGSEPIAQPGSDRVGAARFDGPDRPSAPSFDPSSGSAASRPASDSSRSAGPIELDLPADPPRKPWADLDLSVVASNAAAPIPTAEAGSTPVAVTGPSLRTSPPWVAEVWIDPDWYAAQSPPEPLPTVGPPRVFRLTSPALIGRRSTSRHLTPQIDCGHDVGCSRRQAELTEQAGQWYLSDLDSANGTFVAPAGRDLPTQSISARLPVGPDDRIYLGAWTRIVIRPALPGEVDQDNLNI
ncbi:MAG: FHA domain-containing protein [Propionibacteriaceae bacterium]|jgi:hypothetical protein|nr:FHA domain-containing protein [Propionibacteriaceae bacterium]